MKRRLWIATMSAVVLALGLGRPAGASRPDAQCQRANAKFCDISKVCFLNLDCDIDCVKCQWDNPIGPPGHCCAFPCS